MFRTKESIQRLSSGRRAITNRVFFQMSALARPNGLRSLRVPVWGLDTTLSINPSWICHSIARENRNFKLGRLFQDGDWDTKLTSGTVTERMKYISVGEILDGCPIEETTEFKTYRARSKLDAVAGYEKKGPQNYSREQLLIYMESLARMYKRVAAEGKFDDKLMLNSPIKVGLTRTGEIVKLSDGNHRLALAHYVGLQRMPVQLRVIHAANMEKIQFGSQPLAGLAKYLDGVERRFQKDSVSKQPVLPANTSAVINTTQG